MEVSVRFWIGSYDYKTGEKLYSDDTIYTTDPFLCKLYKKPYVLISKGIKDCSSMEFGEWTIPFTRHMWSKLTKVV